MMLLNLISFKVKLILSCEALKQDDKECGGRTTKKLNQFEVHKHL